MMLTNNQIVQEQQNLFSISTFQEFDFNRKKQEAKETLRYSETIKYASDTLDAIKQLYQSIAKKLELYYSGNSQYKNAILKDIEVIQNNYLIRSKFPRVPNVSELETLEALFSPIKNLCAQLQDQLQNNLTSQEGLAKTKHKYEQLSELLREEQEALSESPFFKLFLGEIKKEIGDKNPQPKGIYFAYAWPTSENKERENWVQKFLVQLKEHLELAGLTTVRLDIISNRYGGNIYDYMQRLEQDDYILLFGTESLKEKHEGSLSAVCTEIIHILRKREGDKARGLVRVFPILLSGSHRTAFPAEYERYITVKDWREKGYLLSFQELYLELFDLAPEHYLSKVIEIWKKELANLPQEEIAQVGIILSKYEEGRKRLLAAETPKLDKAVSLVSNMPLRKINRPWRSYMIWLLFFTVVGTTPFCLKLLFSTQNYSSLFFFKQNHNNVKAKKLFAVKDIYPNFIGRQGYLADLTKVLLVNKNNIPSIVALWGEGGVGKSELAIAFAHKHFKDFSTVYWISSKIKETYDQSYRNLAKELKINFQDKESPQIIRAKVHAYLEEKSFSCPWLLIFDDAIDFLDLPQRGNGSIIITSRNHNPWRFFHCVNVTPFNKEEALELFEKITHRRETEGRTSLIEELEYFPLVLNQVAHYIAETPGMTDERYLRLLKKYNKQSVLEGMPLESRYPYNLAASWQITADYLSTYSKETVEWLYFCSYLFPCSIPQIWIEEWLLKYKAELDSDSLHRKLRANNLLRHLIDYSLVRYDEKNEIIYLPSLKQEIIRSDKGCESHVKQDVLTFLNETIDGLEDLEEMSMQVKTWDKLYKWEPHAAWFLNNFTGQLGNREVAILQNGLGNWRYIKGDFKNAAALHNKSLHIRETLFEKDSPFVAISMYNLAKVLDSEDKYEEAQKLYEKALEINYNVFGKESLKVANNMLSLAWLLKHAGKYVEAKKLVEQALDIKKKLKAEDSQIAALQYALGWMLDMLGKYEEAKQLLEQALETNKKFLPEGHHYISNCMQCLGKVLGQQGKYEEAKKLLEQAVSMYKKSFGEEHPEISDCMFHIGQILVYQERYEEAKKMFQHVMELDKKVVGEAHSNTALDMVYLAWVLAKQAKYDEAKALNKKALELIRERLGEEHPYAIRCLYYLGKILVEQGCDEDATKVFKQVLDSFKNIFKGGEHPYVASCIQSLGRILARQGKFNEAEELVAAAMSMNEKLFGQEHPCVASCMQDLGWIMGKKGKYEEAKAKVKTAIEIYRKFLGYERPSVAKALQNLGIVYFSSGNSKYANKLLKQSLEVYKKTLGIAHPLTIETKHNLKQINKTSSQDKLKVSYEALFAH